MSIDRMTRVNSLLKREIGMAIIQVLGDSTLDTASVTVVDVETSRDLKHARVKISVRDDQRQRQPIFSFLRHHHGRIQDIVSRNVVLKYTPRISFEIDASIEKGDRVLGILSQMQIDDPNPDPLDADPLEPTPETPREQP